VFNGDLPHKAYKDQRAYGSCKRSAGIHRQMLQALECLKSHAGCNQSTARAPAVTNPDDLA